MPCKVVRERNVSRCVVAFDTSICSVRPVATDIVGQDREEIAILATQSIAQGRERTELDGGGMRRVGLHQRRAIHLRDLAVAVR